MDGTTIELTEKLERLVQEAAQVLERARELRQPRAPAFSSSGDVASNESSPREPWPRRFRSSTHNGCFSAGSSTIMKTTQHFGRSLNPLTSSLRFTISKPH